MDPEKIGLFIGDLEELQQYLAKVDRFHKAFGHWRNVDRALAAHAEKQRAWVELIRAYEAL